MRALLVSFALLSSAGCDTPGGGEEPTPCERAHTAWCELQIECGYIQDLPQVATVRECVAQVAANEGSLFYCPLSPPSDDWEACIVEIRSESCLDEAGTLISDEAERVYTVERAASNCADALGE